MIYNHEIVNISFVNRDATPTVEVIKAHKNSAARIIQMYGAYCCGDDYEVYVNGKMQSLNRNGEAQPMILNGRIEAEYPVGRGNED